MFKQYQLRNYRFRLVIYVVLLTLLGIAIIGSAKHSVQKMQIFGMCLGIFVMVVVSLIDYSFILKFNWLIYLADVGLLLMVILFGDKSKGATRWIDLGFFRFQPSELAKILLILFFAYFLAKYHERLNTIQILGTSIVLAGVPLLLIYKQPDLSTTIVTALIFIALLFIAGLSYKIIIGVLAVVIPAALVFISLILQPDQKILDHYQWLRIMGWLNPEKYSDTAYQQLNSITAIGGMILQGIVNGLGSTIVAAYTAGSKIFGLAEQPCNIIGLSLGTYVGQNLGAGRVDRIRVGVRRGILMVLIVDFFIGGAMILFGRQLTAVFVSGVEQAVIEASYPYLLCCGAMMWVLGLLFVYRFSLQSLGDTVVPMLSGALELILRISVVLVLSKVFNLGFLSICIAEVSAWFGAAALLCVTYYIRIHKLPEKLSAKS